MQRLPLTALLCALVLAAGAALAGDEPARIADALARQVARIDALRIEKDRAKAELAPLQKVVDDAHAALSAGRARANEAAKALEKRVEEHNLRPPLVFDDAEVNAYAKRAKELLAELKAARAKSRPELAALLDAFRVAKKRAAPSRLRVLALRDRYNARVDAYRLARTKEYEKKARASDPRLGADAGSGADAGAGADAPAGAGLP